MLLNKKSKFPKPIIPQPRRNINIKYKRYRKKMFIPHIGRCIINRIIKKAKDYLEI